MQNLFLLSAIFFSFCCVILAFLPVNKRPHHKLLIIFWSLTAIVVTATIISMLLLLASSNFDYIYVYNHSSLNTPLVYKISALWAGQEGSFLLWAFILAVIGFLVLRLNNNPKLNGSNKVFGIYAAISFCIFFMCFITQPFSKVVTAARDGLGLNAALQNPWMVIHPPLVFIAYTAMAVLFSLSVAIKPKNKPDFNQEIANWLRISWFFLGFGILAGSIWAYRALGWGGYWSWDPIENAALVPWLIICGYLHCKEFNKRSVCLVPFTIACFGVFLARSGILKTGSAHAYANGNMIVTAILIAFILGVILCIGVGKIHEYSLGKLQNRQDQTKKRLVVYSFDIYAILILAGTIAPIILKTETPKLYYNVVSVVFILNYILFLLFKDKHWLKKRSVSMMILSTILVMVIVIITNPVKVYWIVLLWLCLMPLSLWIVCGFRTNKLRFYLLHIGVILLIIGAISASGLGEEATVVSNPQNGNLILSGIKIPLTKLAEDEIIFETLPTKDVIVQTTEIVALSQGGILIPYSTRPLIILFWLGGFLIIFEPCLVWISKLIKWWGSKRFQQIINCSQASDDMQTCKACNTPVDAAWKFCKGCGNKL